MIIVILMTTGGRGISCKGSLQDAASLNRVSAKISSSNPANVASRVGHDAYSGNYN